VEGADQLHKDKKDEEEITQDGSKGGNEDGHDTAVDAMQSRAVPTSPKNRKK
jgi:hypothetical protein